MSKIVVAPKNMHLSLLTHYRKGDPFMDLKVVSKEELARSVFEFTKEEAIVYLMEKYKYSYEIARMYLADIAYINKDSGNERIHFLYQLKKELIENDLTIPLTNSVYKNKKVKVVGYSKDDFELTHIFNELKIEPEYVLNPEYEGIRIVNCFEKIEDEVYFVLNEIASLIDKGISIKDIYIFRRNKTADYYLKKYAKEFGFQINLKNTNNYFSTGGVKEFLKFYNETKDLTESLNILRELMKDDPQYLEIEDIVLNNTLDGKSFEIKKDYLVNKFKEKMIFTPRYDKAVEVISSPLYLVNKYIFIMGFAQGDYPLSFKDDKFLNSSELNEINRLNQKDKTKLDNCDLIDFFNSPNSFVFSFSKKNSEGEKYLSPISKQIKFNKSSPLLSDIYYSDHVLKLIYSNLKDLEYYYHERSDNYLKTRDIVSIDYKRYSNAYLYKANAYDEKALIPLSTTSLDLYSNCPFHYYLERVLRLDDSESSYALSTGLLAHHMFEHLREDGFDFEREFNGKIAEFDLKPSEKYILTHNVKNQIRVACNAILEREKYYRSPKIYNEINFKHNISDKTFITGTIDNLVVLDNQYFICIDYKTGSTKFDDSKLEFGLSTQLPTYALLTSNSKNFKDLKLVGLYINNVLTSSIYVEQNDDELIPSYLKLNGKTYGDLNIVTSIDSTIADGKSSFISGISLKKDNCSLKDSKAIVSENTFEEYVEKVKELYKDMDTKLRNNVFDISPLFVSERDNACQYCPYKDVCYVKHDQIRIAKKEETSDE